MKSGKKMAIAGACAMIATVAFAFEIDLRTAQIETMPSCVTNESQKRAVQELEKHLALFVKNRNASVNSSSAVFVIGKVAPGCKEAAAHEARAHAVGGKVYFWGDDFVVSKNNMRWGTLYGVYGFLEKVLGVKWVEPGDRGIVLKRRNTVEVPEGWDYRFYPPLEMSVIRVCTARPESLLNPKIYEYAPVALRISEARAKTFYLEWEQWMRRFRHQTRRRFYSGHAFTEWNERFAATRPDLFALDKNGKRGYPGERAKTSDRARWIKLCVSNPAVADQIISDWCNAGTNEYLNISPNDAHGYCLCDGCRAWDCDLPGEDFNEHKTDRYVKLWNSVAGKARAIRPDVKVITYAYAAYRMPPRRERLLYPDNFLIGTVPSINDSFDEMMGGWLKKGLKHYFMRPNYLCQRSAPVLGRERRLYDDFKRNLSAGMIGVDEDNTPRPQAYFEFYTIGRLISEPDLAFEDIEAEYMSQYGSAAPEMKQYFAQVRAREAASFEKSLENKIRKQKGDVSVAYDDTQLYGAAYAAHTEADYDSDLEVVRRALAHADLSDLERWRVNRVRAMIENARLTRKFIYARDSMKTPQFTEVGRELILKRIELKDEIDDVVWGRVFRNYPAEVRWWMWIKDKHLKEFWESTAP
jgi:hypothetical protein